MRRPVRVSLSVLLRIRQDDRYVLVNSTSRPGAFGPPGGVIKYFPPAAALLEQLGFAGEIRAAHVALTAGDLRGQVPARSLRAFLRWFDSNAYRETASECLHREFAEELGEAGLAELAGDVPGLRFGPVRSVVEGPHAVPGQPFRQFRKFVVQELLNADAATVRLAARLVAAAEDPAVPTVILASRAEITHGRCGPALVSPPSAFLFGGRRLMSDLPAVR